MDTKSKEIHPIWVGEWIDLSRQPQRAQLTVQLSGGPIYKTRISHQTKYSYMLMPLECHLLHDKCSFTRSQSELSRRKKMEKTAKARIYAMLKAYQWGEDSMPPLREMWQIHFNRLANGIAHSTNLQFVLKERYKPPKLLMPRWKKWSSGRGAIVLTIDHWWVKNCILGAVWFSGTYSKSSHRIFGH